MDQDQLVERVDQVLHSDPRVLAAWMAGSRARGTADQYSDVDVWTVVSASDLHGFLEDWPKTCDKISPTVFRQRVGGGPIFNQITPEWLRFDIVIGTPEQVPGRSRSTLKLLFDRADLDRRLRPHNEPLQPNPARILALSTEFLRVLGLLPVVMGREEYVVGASGAGLLRGMLIQLMLEDVPAQDRGGALRLEAVLPPERVRVLRELPSLASNRQGVLDAHVACARAFLPLARDLCLHAGGEWPAKMEEAARRRLSATLAVDLP